MIQICDQRTCDRLWSIFLEWEDIAPTDVRAHLQTLDPGDVRFAASVSDSGMTVHVSAVTNRGLEELTSIDGTAIGLTLVGNEVVFSSDD
jgi:hypothetical protein